MSRQTRTYQVRLRGADLSEGELRELLEERLPIGCTAHVDEHLRSKHYAEVEEP